MTDPYSDIVFLKSQFMMNPFILFSHLIEFFISFHLLLARYFLIIDVSTFVTLGYDWINILNFRGIANQHNYSKVI